MVVIDDETKANITSAGTSIWNWISNTLAAGQTNDHHFGSKLEGDEVEKLTHEATHVASKINSKLNSWGLPSLPSFGPLLGLSYIAPANHVVFHSSPWWALFGSLSLSATYVGSLYVWPYLSRKFGWSISPHNVQDIDRSNPKVIISRFISVGFASLASVGVIRLFAKAPVRGSAQISTTFLRWIGLHCSHVLEATTIPLLLTATLFAGPLVTLFLDRSLIFQSENVKETVVASLKDLTWWRNIVVGPVTEEFVFRGCMLPVLASAFGPAGAMLISPLFFGVAHLHSILQHLHKPKEELQVALNELYLQLGYTTVFGLYSSFLYLRTGHLIAPILCHAFCNYIGFPDFEYAFSHPRRKWIIGFYFAGLAAFAATLSAATNPSIYGSIFYAKFN